MADPGLEYFLIRTLPNKKRSLIVALRWGNRSKWRYQHVVPRLKVGLDIAETEAFTDAVKQVANPQNHPKYVRIAKFDRREMMLQVSNTQGYQSKTTHFARWNCRAGTSKKILDGFDPNSNNARMMVWEDFLILLGQRIIFFPISKLDQHQEHKLEFDFPVLHHFRFENELWLLRKDDAYSSTFSRTFGMIDLKKFRKSYHSSSTPLSLTTIMSTWQNNKKIGMHEIRGIAVDSKNYYMHYEKKLKCISRKTQAIVGLFELIAQGAAINGVACRNSNLIYVSTIEALYCLKAISLKMVTMQQYPNKQKFYGQINTMIFSGVEFVVCTKMPRILVAACINFKFQYVYDTEASGIFECPAGYIDNAKGKEHAEMLGDNQGRVYLSGGKAALSPMVVRLLLV